MSEVESMFLSSQLLRPAEQRLSGLPLPCSMLLPGGQRLGAAHPQLAFVVRDTRALLHLAQGAIGRLAEDYVEGRLEIEGNMRDLMATAPALFGNDPTRAPGGWLPRFLGRSQRSIWERTHHSRAKDSAQIQRHYDVSDDFYALWLDAKRVYSCAYFAHPAMTLADAQEAKLDQICKNSGFTTASASSTSVRAGVDSCYGLRSTTESTLPELPCRATSTSMSTG
jgi:cyclopropane-fatty-acyl-phospholipid synthase